MRRSCYPPSSRWRYALLMWLCALCVAQAQIQSISFDTLLPLRAADSSGSASTGSDALNDAVSAPDDTALYESLVAATLSGKPWTGVNMQKFSSDALSQALADVVTHLTTTDTKVALLKKYASLGRQLPGKLDLTGLRAANAAIPVSEWTQALNATQSLLAEAASSNTDAPLLWTCVASLYEIQMLEKNATTLADLDSTKYFDSVRAYFQASTWLAWSVEALSLVQKIDATEVVGKFALNTTDQRWFTSFISTEEGDKTPNFREDASVLTELALLKHVPAALATDAPGAELLGAIASKYLESAGDAVQNGDLKALQTVFQGEEGSDLEDYAGAAQKFCTAAHSSVRFCLLSQLANQGHQFATTQRNLLGGGGGNSSPVTKLPLEAANLNRQQYLETVQNRVTAQTLSLAIVKAFNALSAAVYEASTNAVGRAQSSSLVRVEEQQRAIELQLDQQAASMLSAASSDKATNEQQLSALLQTISTSTAEVDKLFDPYTERLRVIANAAHGAAAAKSVKGFFGLFKKILRALNPVTWITNPGALVDVFSAANDFRKDVSGLKGVKKLIRLLQDGLIPQMNQLTDQLIALYPKLLLIRDALNLIVPPEDQVAGTIGNLTISKSNLNAHSSNFLKVYGEYNNPVLVTDVDVLETLFVNLQSSFCQVGGKKAPQECAQVKTDVQLFDKLREGVAASLGAMDSLVAAARAAVAEQSAKVLSATLAQVSNETSASLSALKAKWASESAQNAREFELYQRQLRYGEAVTSLTLMKASIQSADAAVTACNFFTYLNGGVPVKPCDAVYASPASGSAALDVKQLIAFKLNNKPDVIQRIAYIPTSPSSAGDLHYISLERMMAKSASSSSSSSSSANVTFRLPKDEKWLRKYNWVPPDFDLNSTVAFVTKFQILFPSKQLSSSTLSGSGSNKRTVSVVTQASATSDLGPAVNNKVYEIPRRSFAFRYQEMNSAAINSCELKLANPYQSCDSRLSNYCALSTGEVDTDGETPLPSLFSTFSIQASFSLAAVSSAIKTLSFTGAEVSTPLVVALELQLYSVDSDNQEAIVEDTASEAGSDASAVGADSSSSGSSSRRLRRQASGSSSSATDESTVKQRCCAVGSYLTDWKSKSCAECPEGHTSQLGGLYCVPAPSSA